ncbi:MAG: hypothetical protein ACK5L3_08640 [Oscillospiraceae bacterium]
MNIPKSLKVGGKIYTVEQTEEISIGKEYQGETIFAELAIRIWPSKAQAMREVTFLHEMLHAIYSHLGYFDYSEKKIDELANALHMVIVDNPGVFDRPPLWSLPDREQAEERYPKEAGSEKNG